MATIQIIDDEAGLRKYLTIILQKEGHQIIEAATGAEGLTLFEARQPALVLCDVVLPDLNGLTVLERIRALNPAVPVIVMTGEGNTELAIKAMALGASDYLVKPLVAAQTARIVQSILASLEIADSNVLPEPDANPGGLQLIGKTEAMYEVFKLVGRVAVQSARVLILGESGTGKELVAKAVHTHSHRRNEPFVAINCAAIPEALLESELFGHEKGAFTGADRKRVGKFELAGDGTLFLDEIGEMSLSVQAKMLRVLQDQEFYRLGGDEPVRTTARLVAATNRDLRAEATAGRFREDLYYRLAGIVIRLPPLRERRDDIPLLAEYFLRQSARDLGRPVRGIAPAAMEMLAKYDWPGNVRELANVMQQAVLLTPGGVVMPAQFASLKPTNETTAPAKAASMFNPTAIADHVAARIEKGERDILGPLLTEYERAVIRAAVDRCGGNVSLAATHLGIHRVTLKSKLDAEPSESE